MDISEHIKRLNKKIVLYVTGGGTGVIPQILEQGGMSEWFLEAKVNYAQESTHEILGYRPKHYATEEVARQLALHAYNRAIKLGATQENALGIAATAKLMKVEGERPDRENCIHIAVHTNENTSVYSITLSKVADTTRKTQEISCAFYIQTVLSLVSPDDKNQDNQIGAVRYKCRTNPIRMTNSGADIDNMCVYPGSFNPIHQQHIKIAKTAEKLTGRKVIMELCVHNTDKPTIDWIELDNRIQKIKEAGFDVAITTSPMFIDKSFLFQNSIFVVGTDTFNRILSPQYYSKEEDVYDALRLFHLNNNKFLVFPRLGYEQSPLPRWSEAHTLFSFVTPEEYKDDGTSSTKIRNSYDS